MNKANDKQIAGTHYKTTIEPWDAITSWGLGYLDGNVVKYMARWRKKGGLNDLKKAQHYLEKLIENEEASINKVELTKSIFPLFRSDEDI